MTQEIVKNKHSDSAAVIAEAITIMRRIKLHAESCDCCKRALQDFDR
jgi:hypothetical protein